MRVRFKLLCDLFEAAHHVWSRSVVLYFVFCIPYFVFRMTPYRKCPSSLLMAFSYFILTSIPYLILHLNVSTHQIATLNANSTANTAKLNNAGQVRSGQTANSVANSGTSASRFNLPSTTVGESFDKLNFRFVASAIDIVCLCVYLTSWRSAMCSLVR